MRYDDRLRTVLAQPRDHPHDRAVRWRQLVELLARGGDPGTVDRYDQALAAIARDSPLVDEEVRMAAARAIAPLAAPPELVRAFAADRLSVAAPVLAAAKLTASDWASVAAGASSECRRFIAALRAEAVGDDPLPFEAPTAPHANFPGPVPSISEVVARIEQLRQSRQQSGLDQGPQPGPQQPQPQPAVAEPPEPPRLFRWECDEAGDIAWVDGVPRGAVIGRSIARGGEGGDIDRSVERAFSLRIPFRDARLELAEGSVVGGSWKISGMPAFDSSSGRFSGYRGIAEREGAALHDLPLFGAGDPDSLRELVHELKTPLNAIIGFAEIINGQYLGAAGQAYRDRAAEIVANARVLLVAIDDLDFAARLRADGAKAAATDLAEVVAGVARELALPAESFVVAAPAVTSLDSALSERLVSRFCQSLIAVSDEPPAFRLDQDARHCILGARNPGIDASAEPSLDLRLLIGLARVAGGELNIGREEIRLLLPRA